MIKGIIGGSGITVMGGNTSVPYINMPNTGNMNNPMHGMMRLYGSDIQVFDGSSWLNIGSSYATVELTGENQSIIDWARKKMNEEREYKVLAETHVAIKIALDNLEKAKQQLDATIILSKDHETTS